MSQLPFKSLARDLTKVLPVYTPYGKYKNFVLKIIAELSHTGFVASLALGVKTIWGGFLGTKRSAQIHNSSATDDIVQSMSYFVRNHRDTEQLLTQMRALHASGQIFEVATLVQCVIDEYNDNIQNADFFILGAQVELELHGFTEKVDQFVEQALKLAPYNDVALAHLKLTIACTDLKDGLYDKGETLLRRLVNTTSLRPYASFVLGHQLFWKSNELEEAIELLENAVSERESFLAAWKSLALAYKRVGERLKANYAFQKCAKLDRNPAHREFYERHIERH